MRLILTASKYPELAPIRLREGMLPIGRNDEPFASYPSDLSAQLSARHARVFLEQGNFYISDLGSRNGSLLNGKPVHETPMPIMAGDVLRLGELQFIAGIDEEGAGADIQLELILDPVNADAGLPRLVIKRFPLLIGKNSEPMAQLGANHTRELLFLSRRHAHLYSRDGRVFVEDLGSTNGSYVDSKRLEDGPHCLEDGEILAFGGNFFAFRVSLTSPDATPVSLLEATADGFAAKTRMLSGAPEAQATRMETAPDKPLEPPVQASTPAQPEPESEPEPEPEPKPGYEAGKTTFVSSPTSFLEIFCGDEETPDQGDAAGENSEKPLSTGRTDRTDTKKPRRWAMPVLVLGIAMLIGAAVYLFPQGREQELKELIMADRLEQAAQSGNQWLGETQDTGALQPLATEALMKHVTPPWMGHVKQGAFETAADLLEQAKPLTSNNAVGADMVEILGWAGRLEAFVAERQGAVSRIGIYRDEQAIRDIVDYWEADQIGKQRVLDRITVYVPDFGPFSSQAQSHLRALRTSEAIYLKAIDELSAEMEKGLRESVSANAADRGKKLDALVRKLSRFSGKYPTVTGIEALEQDLAAYRRLGQLLDTRDLSALSAHLKAVAPHTPPFQKHREWMLRKHLPPDSFIRDFDKALEAWRSGAAEQAIGVLTGLVASDWNALARTRLEHFETVFNAYQKLNTSRDKPGHGGRTVAFHRLLDDGDGHFRELLSTDFSTEKNAIIEHADKALSDARVAWDAYRDQGGIDGGLRIERKLSDAYKTRAGLLMEALRHVHECSRLYSSLGESMDKADGTLAAGIRLEVKRQRSWLRELSGIIGPKLAQEKLALLSEPLAEEKTK